MKTVGILQICVTMPKNVSKHVEKAKGTSHRKYVKLSKHDDQVDQNTVTLKQRNIEYRRRNKIRNSAVFDEQNAKETFEVSYKSISKQIADNIVNHHTTEQLLDFSHSQKNIHSSP